MEKILLNKVFLTGLVLAIPSAAPKNLTSMTMTTHMLSALEGLLAEPRLVGMRGAKCAVVAFGLEGTGEVEALQELYGPIHTSGIFTNSPSRLATKSKFNKMLYGTLCTVGLAWVQHAKKLDDYLVDMRIDTRKSLVLLGSDQSQERRVLMTELVSGANLLQQKAYGVAGIMVTHKILCPSWESKEILPSNVWIGANGGWARDSLELSNLGIKRICNHGKNSLWGKSISASAFDAEPWVNIQPDGSLKDGISLAQFKLLADILGFDIREIKTSSGWGLIKPDGTGEGTIGDVVKGPSDVGLVSFETEYYARFGEQTVLLDNFYFLFIVPLRKKIPPIRNILMPLNFEVWMFFGVSLLLAFIVFLLANFLESKKGSSKIYSALDSFLIPFGIIFHEFHMRITSGSGRLFRIFWVFLTMLITFSYVGQLKASFVYPEYEPRIANVEDLMELNIPGHYTAAIEAWARWVVENEIDKTKFTRNFVKHVDKHNCCIYDIGPNYPERGIETALSEGGAFYGRLSQFHYLKDKYIRDGKDIPFEVSDSTSYGRVAMFLKFNSPYTEDLNWAIQLCHELGLLDQLYTRAMPYWDMPYKNTRGVQGNEDPLLMEHFVLLFGLGLTMGLVTTFVLALEMGVTWLKK